MWLLRGLLPLQSRRPIVSNGTLLFLTGPEVVVSTNLIYTIFKFRALFLIWHRESMAAYRVLIDSF